MPIILAPKTPEQISGYQLKYGGVGSRKTPPEILAVMRRLGRALCDVGYLGMSGEADGADVEFHNGARESARYGEIGFAAFIPYNGMRTVHTPGGVYEDHHRGIYNASKFPTWEQAGDLARVARGSFEGLGRGGVALHTRNAFQDLSPSLSNPVSRLICWAQPVGNLGKVSGGTNTAVQIALSHNIPVVNLYFEEKLTQVLSFLNDVEGLRSDRQNTSRIR